MVTKGDLTLVDEYTMQYTDDVLQNCIPETCIISLTNVTPINSIKKVFRSKYRNIYMVINTENASGSHIVNPLFGFKKSIYNKK